MEKFKTKFKVWIDIHFKVTKKEIYPPDMVTEMEKEKLDFDITQLLP